MHCSRCLRQAIRMELPDRAAQRIRRMHAAGLRLIRRPGPRSRSSSSSGRCPRRHRRCSLCCSRGGSHRRRPCRSQLCTTAHRRNLLAHARNQASPWQQLPSCSTALPQLPAARMRISSRPAAQARRAHSLQQQGWGAEVQGG
jgi:hypothetical protein